MNAVLPCLLLVACLPLRGLAAEPTASSASAPKTAPRAERLTLYISGVECPSCVYSVQYNVSQTQGVLEVVSGQNIDNYANVTFDPKRLSVHQLAQTVLDSPPLHGMPYTASLRLKIPAYAKAESRKKIDALFAQWNRQVKVDAIDEAKGELELRFEPLTGGNGKPGPAGWSLDLLRLRLAAPPPQGLGFSYLVDFQKDEN